MGFNGSAAARPKRAIAAVDVRDAKWWEVRTEDRLNSRAKDETAVQVVQPEPAVRDCIGLRPLDLVDWRFVEQAQVPTGPWSLYDRSENMEVRR
jgi:hypothetical protein